MADEEQDKHTIGRREFIKRAAAVAAGTGVLGPLIAACGTTTATQPPAADLTKQRWAAVFDQQDGDTLTPAQLQGWNLLVLDPDDAKGAGMNFSAIPESTVKLAYVDVGEIENYRSDFSVFKDAGVLLGPTMGSKGDSYAADIRKPEYYPLMKARIEKILASGLYNGIMLDALDTTLALSKSSNDDDSLGNTGSVDTILDGKTEPYSGMKQAAVELVRKLRTDFPDIQIMVNRGFDITADLAQPVGEHKSAINSVMAESTITDSRPKENNDGSYGYGDGTNVYKFWSNGEYDPAHAVLKSSGLPVYGIDYWNHNDKSQAATIEKIYQDQRNFGMCPYVTTDDKQHIYREPQQKNGQWVADYVLQVPSAVVARGSGTSLTIT